MTSQEADRSDGTTDEEAGEDRGRFLAFSDGVFAFAATLLVVSLAAPVVGHDQESDLTSRLVALWPQALAYAISFLVVTSFWSAHRQLFRRIRRLDATLTAMNAGLLLLVAALPFPSSVLGLYASTPVAVALYAGTLTAIGILLLAVRLYALSENLFRRTGGGPHEDRVETLQALSYPAVFALSIPIAYATIPSRAMYFWIVLIPLNMALNRLRRRRPPHRARA
jgi:uncharacterized membrane protein